MEIIIIILRSIGVWRSLVSRMVRVHEAAGSNPATPTTDPASTFVEAVFFFIHFIQKGIFIMAYRIITEATADLNSELLAGLPEVTVIPMFVQVDGVEYQFGPGGNISAGEFYAQLRSGKFASTSQINPAVYRSYFEQILKQGMDVLYLCFSSGLSSTIQSARIAISELEEEYPDRKILLLDTLAASVGEGLFVMEAARKQSQGMELEELAAWLEAHKLNLCHWFTVDTFDHLKHGGRVSAASAAVGSLLGIKPLLHVDDNGKLVGPVGDEWDTILGNVSADTPISLKVIISTIATPSNDYDAIGGIEQYHSDEGMFIQRSQMGGKIRFWPIILIIILIILIAIVSAIIWHKKSEENESEENESEDDDDVKNENDADRLNANN